MIMNKYESKKKKKTRKSITKNPQGSPRQNQQQEQQQMFLETKGKLSKVKYQRDPVEDFIHTNTEE